MAVSKEIIESTAVGVVAGITLTTLLRLPVLGMFFDCDCPEMGASIIVASGGAIGGIIGWIRGFIKERNTTT